MRAKLIMILPLALLAACQADRSDSSADDAAPRPAGPGFDTHPTTASNAPRLEGASGILRYEDGCLYLEAGGGKTGLVMPDIYRFDGQTLASPKRTVRLGDQVSFSGGFAEMAQGNYRCEGKTSAILLVDYTAAAPN